MHKGSKNLPQALIILQVRDLMIFLEARQTIEAAGGGELEGASVLPVPEQQQQQQQQQAGAGRGHGGGRRGKRR